MKELINYQKRTLILGLIIAVIGLFGIIFGILSEVIGILWYGIGFFLFVIPGIFLVIFSILPLIDYFHERYRFYSIIKSDSLSAERKLNLINKRRRENRNALIISITVVILVLSAVFSGVYIPKINQVNRIYGYGEIVIQREKDFTERYGFPGTGTVEDPYRLENLTIETNNYYGIRIEKVKSNFVIRNCTILSSSACIFIFEVFADKILIENNLLRSNSSCIYLEFCQNVELIGNICFGYQFYVSQHDFWSGSTGISLWDSYNVKISKNNCSNGWTGIFIRDSDYLTIDFNNCSNNSRLGFDIQSSYHIFFVSNIGHDNGEGAWIMGTRYSYISNNQFHQNYAGMVVGAINTTILQNNCSFNNYLGFRVWGYYNLLTQNLCKNNSYGMISDCIWSTITMNLFYYNSYYGLYIDEHSEDNNIYLNNFVGNNFTDYTYGHAQAFEASENVFNNFWYDSVTLAGNYWSNLIWGEDVVYVIDGSNNSDPYPLEDPVVF